MADQRVYARTFSQTLTLVAGLFCLEKRVSYRRLRKEFDLDDEILNDRRADIGFEPRRRADASAAQPANSRSVTIVTVATPRRHIRSSYGRTSNCRFGPTCRHCKGITFQLAHAARHVSEIEHFEEHASAG